MNRLNTRITYAICFVFAPFLIYYGISLAIYPVVFPYWHYGTHVIVNSKLIQPTGNQTHTLCTSYGTYNPLRHFSHAILTDAEINRTKLEWQSFARSIPAYPSNKYFGRGIVSSATSGFHRCHRLIASLKLLRWMKCRLPVEVFMRPGELNAEEINEFEKIPNVTVRVIQNSTAPTSRNHDRFAIKPGSILYSSFEHVLWLDSDNIVVRDPEYLFDLPHYTHSTAIFWPDLWTTPGSNPIWKILDVPCRAQDYEQESGQIVINKRLAWKALNLALYFNTDHLLSRLVYGDKDVYRLSWKALNIHFHFIQKYPGLAGFNYAHSGDKNVSDKNLGFCGHSFVQYDPLGDILFLHSHLVKRFPQIAFPVENRHFPLKEYTNVWRVYRRYANSSKHYIPRMFGLRGIRCATLLVDRRTNQPPLFEDDFHNQVSAATTAQYLSYLNGSVIRSHKTIAINVKDRNWEAR